MIDTKQLEDVLLKVNVRVFDLADNPRSIVEVLEELSNVWDALSIEYQYKIYEALGIKQKHGIWVDNSSIQILPFNTSKGTGIEYLKNTPTSSVYNVKDDDDKLIDDIKNGRDIRQYL